MITRYKTKKYTEGILCVYNNGIADYFSLILVCYELENTTTTREVLMSAISIDSLKMNTYCCFRLEINDRGQSLK